MKDDINVEYKFKDRRKAWFFAWLVSPWVGFQNNNYVIKIT